MIYHLRRIAFGLSIVFWFFFTLTSDANAEMSTNQEEWQFSGSVYLWAAGVKGTDTAGDEIDASFSDMVKNLDGGLMGIVGARRGKWTLLVDIIYLSIHQETNAITNITGVPSTIDIDMKLKGFVSTFGIAYRVVENDMINFDLLVGARYFKLDLDFNANIERAKAKYSDNVLDGIIGTQVKIDISDSWYLSFYADVGAGDSKLTWQAWPGVGCRLENFDVVAGYRHLAWETDDGYTIEGMSFSGPTLGVVVRF